MDRILARLERRLGRFAIPNLTTFVVGGMAMAFVLSFVRPELPRYLALDLAAVRQGQVWRLVSYLFIPQGSSPLWIVFQLYMTWFIGRSLEAEWGAFKLNVFYLLGMFGTTLAAWISGGAVGNVYLNTSIFLAFATVFPELELMLILLPVRAKWLGMVSAAFLVYEALSGTWGARAAITAAMTNYLLFFGGHLYDLLRQRNVALRQKARRASGAAPSVSAPPKEGRSCSACGTMESAGADIRVCSCAKCGKPTLFCLEHARNH